MTIDLETEITKLEKALIKQGRQDFVIEMRRANPQERKAKLLSLAEHLQEIVSTKARDEELKAASEKKKELEAPYKEQTLMNGKLSRFIHLVTKEDEGG